MAVDHVHHFFFRSNFVKNFPNFASLSCDYISLIREFNSAILVLSWPWGRTWMERNLQPNILIFFCCDLSSRGEIVWVSDSEACFHRSAFVDMRWWKRRMLKTLSDKHNAPYADRNLISTPDSQQHVSNRKSAFSWRRWLESRRVTDAWSISKEMIHIGGL